MPLPPKRNNRLPNEIEKTTVGFSNVFPPPDFLMPDLSLHPPTKGEFLYEQRVKANDLFTTGCTSYQKGSCPAAIECFKKSLDIFNELYEQLKDCRDADCFATVTRKMAFSWYKLASQLYTTLHLKHVELNSEEVAILNIDIENAINNAIIALGSLLNKTKQDYEALAFFYAKIATFNLTFDLPKSIHNFKLSLDYLSRIEDGSGQQSILQTARQLITIYDQEAQKAFDENNYAKTIILCKQALCTYKHHYKPYANGDNGLAEITHIDLLFAKTLVEMADHCAKENLYQEAIHKYKEACAVLKEQLNSVSVTAPDRHTITLELVKIMKNLANMYINQKEDDNAIACYKEALLRLNEYDLKDKYREIRTDLSLQLAAVLLRKQNGRSIVPLIRADQEQPNENQTPDKNNNNLVRKPDPELGM